MIVEFRKEWHPPYNVGGDIRFRDVRDGRWVRFGIYLGSAPGSHMGFWRTRCDSLCGVNYRIGSLRCCVTILVHWRRR